MDTNRYRQWEDAVPRHERDDPLWKLEAYRLARFAAHDAWPWVNRIRQHPMGNKPAHQLHDAAWSVPVNIAAGYGRSSTVDRLRFYDYALGSVRETIVWYASGSQVIDASIPDDMLGNLASVRRLLLTMLASERRATHRKPFFGNF